MSETRWREKDALAQGTAPRLSNRMGIPRIIRLRGTGMNNQKDEGRRRTRRSQRRREGGGGCLLSLSGRTDSEIFRSLGCASGATSQRFLPTFWHVAVELDRAPPPIQLILLLFLSHLLIPSQPSSLHHVHQLRRWCSPVCVARLWLLGKFTCPAAHD